MPCLHGPLLTPEMLAGLRDNPDSLIDIILRQAERIRQLQLSLEKLQARVDEQSGRAGGAAPFRRPEHKRKQKPLQPGRGKGHEGSFRQKSDRVDRTVESPLLCCPHCQGAVEQYLIDIPPVAPVVTRIITTHAYCPRCRRRVRSTHPLQVSAATGAAGVHLGPPRTRFRSAIASCFWPYHEQDPRRAGNALWTSIDDRRAAAKAAPLSPPP